MKFLRIPFIANYSGFISGLLLFLIILYGIPGEMMPEKARQMAAITSLMACWWITEAIPIPATALLPIALFPIFKIMKTGDVSVKYGHSLVFLFLGGFIIAKCIERWNLHRRIALNIIRVIGTNPRKMVLGFMVATAFLSMWISNTASTMMMLPVALAVITQLNNPEKGIHFRHNENNFALSMMLAIAYGSSIGGIATIIGTPPNLIFIGILKSSFPAAPEISFLKWLIFALPFSMLFLPVAWFYLVYIAAPVKQNFDSDKKDIIVAELRKLGQMSQAEKLTLVVFIMTGLLWIFRSDINLGAFTIFGWTEFIGLQNFIDDSTIAVGMAVLTFVIPSGNATDKEKRFLMSWSYAENLPWGILILFGGGFALASGFEVTKLTFWLGEQLTSFKFLPVIAIVLLVSTMTTFITEFTSNTAIAATLLPISAGFAIALEINPLLLMIPVTISSSTAFMLPVATPPNAIVFGSGYIRMKDMVKIGLIMNLIGLILVMLFMLFSAPFIFNFDWIGLPEWVM